MLAHNYPNGVDKIQLFRGSNYAYSRTNNIFTVFFLFQQICIVLCSFFTSKDFCTTVFTSGEKANSYTVAPLQRRLPVTKQAWSATAILWGPFFQKKALFSETEKCYCVPRSSVINHHLIFSTSYFKSFLSTISIKRVNAMPLSVWDFLPRNFEVLLKIMTIAKLFITMTTSPV